MIPSLSLVTVAPGQTARFSITKPLEYTVYHNGWGLVVQCSDGQLIVKAGKDGGLVIGSVGGTADDEV